MTWTPETIRELREHAGLSQTDFADALGFNRYQSVSELETGKREASLTIQRLLDFIAAKYGFGDAQAETPAEATSRIAAQLEGAAQQLRGLDV